MRRLSCSKIFILSDLRQQLTYESRIYSVFIQCLQVVVSIQCFQVVVSIQCFQVVVSTTLSLLHHYFMRYATGSRVE
uniref:Ovule protein n=1 Tax=Ditylenchus dipsaci TaxID=166011 RepID=A0A915D3N3_9BILA